MLARRRSSVKRMHATADTDFFKTFVIRYHDKQYQTWLGAEFTQVGIDYEKHLTDRVAAGIANHFFGMSFPRYLSLIKNNEITNTIPKFERTFDRVELNFYSTSFAFLQEKRPTISEDQKGILHAELFLLRLLTSLQAARRLINWGYFAEPLTILRSSLEQIAWAYAVGVNFDKKQLEKPQSTKCIYQFKQRFRFAGNLYGALSHYSHMNFEAQKQFITVSDNSPAVMQQSIEFKFFGLLFYAFLMISFQYVCRDIRLIYMTDYNAVYSLRNVVLPLRVLVASALMRHELDRDEVAAILSEICFDTFPDRP